MFDKFSKNLMKTTKYTFADKKLSYLNIPMSKTQMVL